jgi:hypothetical protein
MDADPEKLGARERVVERLQAAHRELVTEKEREQKLEKLITLKYAKEADPNYSDPDHSTH